MSGPSRRRKKTGKSMSSAEGSPVKTSARQVGERASMARGLGYGLKCSEWWLYYDQNTSWWRTRQACLPLFARGTKPPSDGYSGSYPRAGMTRSGKLFRLPPLVPHISGTGCLSSPTLRATETDSGSYQRDRGRRGKERATLLGKVRGWAPTLKASDTDRMSPSERGRKNPAVPMFILMQPTLTASQADKGPRKTATKAENGGHQVNLVDRTAHLSGKGGGVLNPRWCEWYMGFPDGWCDLPSTDLETL